MAIKGEATPAKVWWEKLLGEAVLGRSGLSAADAIEKYTAPGMWRQDGPRTIGREELEWHFEWVRSTKEGMDFEVQHAIRDGDFFAAVHTVTGPNGDKGDYELEVITFGQTDGDRIAWIKELYWLTKGEATSWDHEFEDFKRGAKEAAS
jgi:SnoaL-like domain